MRTVLKSLLLCFLLLSAAPVLAQDEPPARVGRVSITEGAVAFYGPGDSDWSAAKVNLPVAEGGWFATGPEARTQFRIGPDALDLAPGTQINFARLREGFMQVALSQGRLYLHLQRRQAQAETDEIDLGRGGVWLAQPGIYDIDNGTAEAPTRITVFEGSARFVGGGIDRTIRSGEQLVVSGSDQLSAELQPARPDEFDEWSRRHEYRPPRVAAARVSPTMTGVAELAEYGTWNTVPQYGAVWFPRAVPDHWAPYRAGHWVWIEPWGWNWVDDEPWGFAPFHYGRWARVGYRWAWVPGDYVPEPVYAPALVAFIPPPAIEAVVRVDVVDAGPPVGWFPLAPGEVYWPTYTRDPRYIRNLNITNVSVTKITNITNVIVNQPAAAEPPRLVVEQRFANRTAATVVPARAFADSKPVARAAVPVPATALQRVAVDVKPPPVVASPAVAAVPKPATGAAGPPATSAASAPGTVAKATPAHPPAAPRFSNLAPAPRVHETASAEKPQPAAPAQPAPPGPQANRPPTATPEKALPSPPAATAAIPPAQKSPGTPAEHAPAGKPPGAAGVQPPTPPDFSHLTPAKPPSHAPAAVPAPERQPAAAGAAREPAPSGKPAEQATAPTPGHPPPPNFGHLAPERATPHAAQPAPTAGTAPNVHPPEAAQQHPAQAAPGAPEPNRHAPAAAQPAPNQAAQQRAAEEQARQRASHEAQQRAAQEAQQRAAQQAQQRAAQEAQQRAAQQAQQRASQEAQQRAAQEAQRRAAQEAQQRAAQQAQQRAAQEAQQRAAQQAQQRAAQEAQQRAAQQAQQRAAQEAQQRAAQQAQQRAAQEAQQRAAQQAQQRAAQEAQQRAAQQAQQRAAQEAQQRAAAEAARQHAAQQAAQQHAAAPQGKHGEPGCGDPGKPACPK